jgi:succinoglycan biosynthesis transport protein ExoP
METSQYLRLLRRWWWLLGMTTAVGGVVAYVASSFITPTYEGTTTLLVVQQQTPGIIERNDLETSVLLANTFRGMITVRPLLEQAIERGSLPLTTDELRNSLAIENPRDSQLLRIVARASTPELARDIANVVSEVFITSDELALTNSAGKVSVIEPSVAPDVPVSPRKSLNALLGASLALTASTLLVLLFEYLDDTVKSARDVFELTGLQTLGRVDSFGRTEHPGEQLQAALHPRSTLAESYRALRTNLANTLGRYGTSGEAKTVLLTGGARGDGKTTTTANLGVMFGMAGYRVVVVDGDLRAPSLHRVFSLDNSDGLANLLLSEGVTASRAVQRTVHTNVFVLTSGPIPGNPSELLGSSRMRDVLDELTKQYDLVLLDSPPALGITDSSVLAAIVDAVAIVLRPGKTRTGDLRATVEQLATSGTPLVGVIMNRAHGSERALRYGEGYEGDVPTGGERLATPSRFGSDALESQTQAVATTSNVGTTGGRTRRLGRRLADDDTPS